MSADAPELGFSAPPPRRQWRVMLGDGSTRVFAADGFRVDAGALVLLLPAGCVAAFAPGQWLTVDSALGAVVPEDAA